MGVGEHSSALSWLGWGGRTDSAAQSGPGVAGTDHCLGDSNEQLEKRKRPGRGQAPNKCPWAYVSEYCIVVHITRADVQLNTESKKSKWNYPVCVSHLHPEVPVTAGGHAPGSTVTLHSSLMSAFLKEALPRDAPVTVGLCVITWRQRVLLLVVRYLHQNLSLTFPRA